MIGGIIGRIESNYVVFLGWVGRQGRQAGTLSMWVRAVSSARDCELDDGYEG